MRLPEENRKRVVAVVVVGALVGGAFAAGRFSAPRVVETRDVERVVYKDLSVEDLTKNYAATKVITKTVWRNVIVRPDGTKEDKTIEREGADEKINAKERSAKTTVSEGERERIVTKTVTLQPDWRIGVQVGASLRQPALPITGPLVIGVQAERRIVGGVSAGLWANTVGAGGAVVSVEF